MAKTNRRSQEASSLIRKIHDEANTKAVCSSREGLFRAVLKASFIRTFDYVEHLNVTIKDAQTPEGFFSCAPLRQGCEDLIALSFIVKLPRKERDTVIQSLLVIATSSGIEKQEVASARQEPERRFLARPLAELE